MLPEADGDDGSEELMADDVPAAAEVVVVGAGLAGLSCARRLARAGVDVVLLEAGETVGGRVRTDTVDGFRCDRGFQLLNPAYPEVRRELDLGALRLQSFPAALVVATGRSRRTLADPRRAVGLLPATVGSLLRGGVGSVREQAALGRWALRAARVPPRTLLDEPDLGWGQALTDQGVDSHLRRRVIEPFLAGVLGERDGSTSHRFTQLLVRSFVRGTPAVPWRGMQAVPDQLAEGVPRIHLGVRVESVEPGAVRTADREIRARCVVVATDPSTATRMLALPPVRMRALTTFWHVSPEPPTSSGALHVDGDDRGPMVNSIVITNRAPGYSPDQRALIATTVLGEADDQGTERILRSQLEQVYGTTTQWWELVRRHVVPEALTAMEVPLRPRLPVALHPGLVVAGDHRDTASTQGAMVSGRRAADAVLADLGRPAVPREARPA
jgi:glycine/D-amino acid oxidase-like deaminating enzyme